MQVLVARLVRLGRQVIFTIWAEHAMTFRMVCVTHDFIALFRLTIDHVPARGASILIGSPLEIPALLLVQGTLLTIVAVDQGCLKQVSYISDRLEHRERCFQNRSKSPAPLKIHPISNNSPQPRTENEHSSEKTS